MYSNIVHMLNSTILEWLDIALNRSKKGKILRLQKPTLRTKFLHSLFLNRPIRQMYHAWSCLLPTGVKRSRPSQPLPQRLDCFRTQTWLLLLQYAESWMHICKLLFCRRSQGGSWVRLDRSAVERRQPRTQGGRAVSSFTISKALAKILKKSLWGEWGLTQGHHIHALSLVRYYCNIDNLYIKE